MREDFITPSFRQRLSATSEMLTNALVSLMVSSSDIKSVSVDTKFILSPALNSMTSNIIIATIHPSFDNSEDGAV